ncbi:hypothetical protein BC832DRAFT_595232 [Gaertneriomyces semiglobifer]|nr:hypothetical protein BC832DRAFT_595232 [Gaertneriomyces semiglobifer]
MLAAVSPSPPPPAIDTTLHPSSSRRDEVDSPTEFIVTTIGNAVADEVRSMRHLTSASKRRSALIWNTSPLELVDSYSEKDLRSKLKDALAALKDKERDLTLAAEIGQQLVAANNALLHEYQDLVNRSKATPPTSPTVTPPPTSYHTNLYSSRALARRPSRTSLRSDSSGSSSHVLTLHKQRSNGTLNYVNSLERANADLRAQLDVLEANLRDAERIHRHTVSNLRRANAGLQDQLRNTLQDLRDVEVAHARANATLERDLDQLRNELQATAQSAAELEVDRRRLIREQAEARKDTKDIEDSDQQIIDGLQNRVKELEEENARLLSGKKESERRCMMQKVELEELGAHAEQLQKEVEESRGLREHLTHLSTVVEELHGQLEDMRAIHIGIMEEEMSTADITACTEQSLRSFEEESLMIHTERLTPAKEHPNWEWTEWVERTRTRCWELDVAGLRQEITDLRTHREEAYDRVRNNLRYCTQTVVQCIPRPIASLASIASSVINTVVPRPVVGLASSVARGMQNGFERRVLGVNRPKESKEAPA